MTAPCVTVADDESFDAICRTMEKSQIRRLVVVDGDGVCCGVVAQADIARHVVDKAGEVVHEVSQPAAPRESARRSRSRVS